MHLPSCKYAGKPLSPPDQARRLSSYSERAAAADHKHHSTATHNTAATSSSTTTTTASTTATTKQPTSTTNANNNKSPPKTTSIQYEQTTTTTSNPKCSEQPASSSSSSNLSNRHSTTSPPYPTDGTCNCSLMFSDVQPPVETSILERKPEILIERKVRRMKKYRKEQRDAATSPDMPKRYPARVDKSTSMNASPHRALSVDRTLLTSPRREVTMRNAATSPAAATSTPNIGQQRKSHEMLTNKQHLETKQHQPELPSRPVTPRLQSPENNSSSKSSEETTTVKLAPQKPKSSDKRSTRQLRTTRSLSPKPPVRHQQSIIVSDEFDMVFLVTPVDGNDSNNDNDEVFASGVTPSRNTNSLEFSKRRGKAHSEHTSPNLSSGCGGTLGISPDSRFTNNRSTGCLVYVPTDPWVQQEPKKKNNNNNNSKNNETNSQSSRQQQHQPGHSKHELENPWVYRELAGKKGNNTKNSEHLSNAALSPRPRQPRNKLSESLYQETSKIQERFENAYGRKTSTTTYNNHSPMKLPPAPPSPPSTGNESRSRAHHFLLNVANNPNALQPRHSFSTLLPPKDDELQLNIRRLSEQIKGGTGYVNAAQGSPPPLTDFSKYLEQQQRRSGGGGGGKQPVQHPEVTSAMTVAKQTAAYCGASDADTVLETTC